MKALRSPGSTPRNRRPSAAADRGGGSTPSGGSPPACRSGCRYGAVPRDAAGRFPRSAGRRRCGAASRSSRRRHRGLGDSVGDHPAPLESERRIDLAAAGPIIGVAERVVPDQFAVAAGVIRGGVEGRPVPPGEELQKKLLHPSKAADRLSSPPRPSARDYGEARRACPVELCRDAPKSLLRPPAESDDAVNRTLR